jgi:hypothetical protein
MLAICEHASLFWCSVNDEEKSFKKLTAGANVLKLFSSPIFEQNKLEC